MKNNGLSVIISQNMPNLTNKEKEIADYLLNPEIITNEISVKSILQNTSSSFSTLYNFLKKIGYPNIKDLILAIYQEQIDRESSKKIINSKYQEVDDVTSSYFKILKTNSENINFDQLDKLIDNIVDKNNVYFAGFGESYLTCVEISYRLTRFGLSAMVLDRELGSLVSKALTLKPSDLLICISISGESRGIVEAAKIAKKRGVTCFSVSTNENSSLSKICDENIQIFYPISKSEKEFYVSTFLSTIYLIDILSKRLISKYGQKFEDFMNISSNEITKMVKIKK